MIWNGAAFMLLGFAQSPVDDSELLCIVQQIPASSRTAMVDEDMSTTVGPILGTYVNAAAICAREREWTTPQTQAAFTRAVSHDAIEEMSRRLRENGIQSDLIRSWFVSRPEEERRRRPTSQQAFEELGRHLADAGVTRQRFEANAGAIGTFIGALRSMEFRGRAADWTGQQ